MLRYKKRGLTWSNQPTPKTKPHKYHKNGWVDCERSIPQLCHRPSGMSRRWTLRVPSTRSATESSKTSVCHGNSGADEPSPSDDLVRSSETLGKSSRTLPTHRLQSSNWKRLCTAPSGKSLEKSKLMAPLVAQRFSAVLLCCDRDASPACSTRHMCVSPSLTSISRDVGFPENQERKMAKGLPGAEPKLAASTFPDLQ